MLSIKNTVQIITPSQKDYVRPGTLDATFTFLARFTYTLVEAL